MNIEDQWKQYTQNVLSQSARQARIASDEDLRQLIGRVALQARLGLFLGCVGLALFLLPVLSVLARLPIGIYLLPVSLFLGCLTSLAGIILSIRTVSAVEQAKPVSIGLVLSGLALGLSLMLGLFYLLAIFSGFL